MVTRFMPEVTLNDADFDMAIQVGLQRETVWQNAKEPSLAIKFDRDRHLAANIQATAAEIAVARYLNREWLGATYTGPQGCDVDPNIEVRLTERGRGLFIKNREITNTDWQKPPSTVYVLTYETEQVDTFNLAGWITLGDALEHARRYEHNKVIGWICPPTMLRPVEELYGALN